MANLVSPGVDIHAGSCCTYVPSGVPVEDVVHLLNKLSGLLPRAMGKEWKEYVNLSEKGIEDRYWLDRYNDVIEEVSDLRRFCNQEYGTDL